DDGPRWGQSEPGAEPAQRGTPNRGLTGIWRGLGDGGRGFGRHHFGGCALPGANRAIDPSAHGGRAFGPGPVDATTRRTQGMAELGQHARGRVTDHPATGIALFGPVLLVELVG